MTLSKLGNPHRDWYLTVKPGEFPPLSITWAGYAAFLLATNSWATFAVASTINSCS